jgi:hypothetical protein
MRNDGVTYPGIGIYPVQGKPENPVPVFMVTVIGKFIPDIQQDHKNTGQSNGQSRDIYKRE